MPVKAIVTDIEGTTSSISFVVEVLFPFAKQHLPAFVAQHQQQPEVADQLAAVRVQSGETDASVERVVEILLSWIAEDRKATPLKALQGMIWAQGYQSGQIKGHVYPDAVEALARWHTQGYALYVYSSGSVQAQKLIFGYSVAGDLTPLFQGYFDTTTGPKREVSSYKAITQAIGLAPDEILFLSDIVQELDAAQAAGLQTCGLVRAGGELAGHANVASFAVIDPGHL